MDFFTREVVEHRWCGWGIVPDQPRIIPFMNSTPAIREWEALALVPDWHMPFVNGRGASHEYTLRPPIRGWTGTNPWWVLFFDGFVRSLKAYNPQTYRHPARNEPTTHKSVDYKAFR